MEKSLKFKRRSVDWYQLLSDIGDLSMSEEFWLKKSRFPNRSNNRIAYNVLKTHYSTTTLAYVRLHGGNIDSLEEYFNILNEKGDYRCEL